MGQSDNTASIPEFHSAENLNRYWCQIVELSVQVPLVRLGWLLRAQQIAANDCQKGASTRCLGRARLGQGRIEEAIKLLATGADLQYLGYAYGRAGRREEAERFAVAAAPNAFTQALTFAGLGDKDRTLEALDRLASLGAVRVGRALNSPEFALLRGDPRVKALRKKVGLPEQLPK
jgi:hypothetical protein